MVAHPHYGRIPVVNAMGLLKHRMIFVTTSCETPSRINVPVGKPVQNMRIYVLSASDQLCPVGYRVKFVLPGSGIQRLPEQIRADCFTFRGYTI
ncbi:hypothetical protein CS542_09155 [Pedobacter sp. IW39]|nr:hypothetical protein CS542_09155 [Pedobacter sp. IW39]